MKMNWENSLYHILKDRPNTCSTINLHSDIFITLILNKKSHNHVTLNQTKSKYKTEKKSFFREYIRHGFRM